MEVRVIAKEKELRELTGGLEQQIMERTKELERTKQNLEEMNLMLEIRVKARIHEFKRLNQTFQTLILKILVPLNFILKVYSETMKQWIYIKRLE